MTQIKADLTLDARGLNCPMPLLKLKQKLNAMASQQVIEVLTTDQGSVRDFAAFVKQANHETLDFSENGAEYRFIIKKH